MSSCGASAKALILKYIKSIFIYNPYAAMVVRCKDALVLHNRQLLVEHFIVPHN